MKSIYQLSLFQETSIQLPYAMKKHWATRLHDDIRLQYGNVLLSWALLGKPICRVGEKRVAIEMEDHRKENILFEGVHSTGTIMVWDCGSWAPFSENEDVPASLARGFLRFALRGGKLQGIWTLTRKSKADRTRRAVWELQKEGELFDRPSVFDYMSEAQPVSIYTQRTKEEIERDWKGSKPKPPTLFD